MSQKYNKLAGKRVLVLGATAGMGFCIAEGALEYGAKVFISSSSQANVDKTLARLKEGNPAQAANVLGGHPCDLLNPDTQEANLAKLLDAATSNGQDKLDHIASTAGNTIDFATLDRVTPSYIASANSVRVTGHIHLAKVAQKYIRSDAGSSITLTSGVLASKPAANLGAVVPSISAGVEGLGRGLAQELKPVRVNVVAPGAVHTEIFDKMPAESKEAMLEAFKRGSLTNEVGRPEDVAEAFLYAMKDRFVTGTVIHSNGGALLV